MRKRSDIGIEEATFVMSITLLIDYYHLVLDWSEYWI